MMGGTPYICLQSAFQQFARLVVLKPGQFTSALTGAIEVWEQNVRR